MVEKLEKLGICWERKCNANICWDTGLLDLHGVSLDSHLTAAAGTILGATMSGLNMRLNSDQM